MSGGLSIDEYKKYAVEALTIGGVAAVLNIAGIDTMVAGMIAPLAGALPGRAGGAVVVGGTIFVAVFGYNIVSYFITGNK